MARKSKSPPSRTKREKGGATCNLQFCYFHQRMVRGVRTPPQSRLHPIALIESEEAIQASLMEVINALARNTIDLKRAELIIRSLHIAVKNAHRVKFQVQPEDMVKEVPDYPAPTAPIKPAPAAVVEPAEACKELIEADEAVAARVKTRGSGRCSRGGDVRPQH